MSTRVMSAGVATPPPAPEAIGMIGRDDDADLNGKFAITEAFAAVGAPAGDETTAAGELEPGDALGLLALWLPRAAAASGGADIGVSDIVVPEEIVQDSRRRTVFKLGVSAARELGLDAGALGTDDVMALGRQTVADHVMAGTADSVLVAMARAEGKVDEAAWAARDKEKIAAQVDAFVRAEFKDEIALHDALEGLAAEPPLLGRRELADALLREQGIDTDARLGGYDVDLNAFRQGELDYERSSIAGSSAPLIRKWQAGQEYFNQDKLTAEHIRKMRMRGGATPTQAQIEEILGKLPQSLDAEFTSRFDEHQRRMSTHLSNWIAARLSLHAREMGIDLAGTAVTVSRAKLRISRLEVGLGRYSTNSHITKPLRGFVIAIERGDKTHRCFISSGTGAVHVVPAEETVESWLRNQHELAFEDVPTRAEPAKHPGRWFSRIIPEHVAHGSHGAIREQLCGLFHAEIEQGREAVRGQNRSEGVVDGLLNLIPFRAMVVALRKGDIPTAIMMGGLDVLSLAPLVGAGVRLGGAAVKSATPWIAMGMRFGGTAGRQGVGGGLRRLTGGVGGIAARLDRIKASLAESAIHGWGRLRPLDVQRVATALRATSPRLADILSGIATRTRGATIPDGVWRVGGSTTAANTATATATATATVTTTASGAIAIDTANAVRAISSVTAHNLEHGTLSLLPYGRRTGVYTQIDASGQRIGALLVADSGGWLHRTMPAASLERYRVSAPDVVSALGGRRVEADGTVMLNGNPYARLGDDYVQVARDFAVSTAARPIWRVLAPPGIAPDVIAHRLVHDRAEGLWRQAEIPGLAGGSGRAGRYDPQGGVATNAAKPSPTQRVVSDDAQLARFGDALVAGMRDGTPEQAQALRAALDRVAEDRRGRAILNAMSAHYELLGRAPEIALSAGADAAGLRPSLARPASGTTWYLDLEAFRVGTREAAVYELAAVYNNMTGVLQNVDPFEDMLAQGGPALDPDLEHAWARWLAEDAQGSELAAQAAAPDAAPSLRQLTVHHLRQRLREMRCYGGLDRATLKAALRNLPGRWEMRVDLSHRGLDSIPPLPVDTKVLYVTNNRIRDWTNLPAGLTSLYAESTGMSALPSNLPAGLKRLDVSGNRLAGSPLVLPAGLVRLSLGRNGLRAVPDLPDHLQELVLHENSLETLPANLPRGLKLLDVSANALAQLPEDLPAGLHVLLAGYNRLEQLARLPDGLQKLDVISNRLVSLPPLPAALRTLKVAVNALTELPAGLPRGLEILIATNNRLSELPSDLPRTLRTLAVEQNVIDDLPVNIVELVSCTIRLDGNPLPVAAVPLIVDRDGPRIFFTSREVVRPSLAQVLRYWRAGLSLQAQSRWDVIARSLRARADAMEFALFLDRLRKTVSYSDPVFRAQVQDWLIEVSKPERATLLDESLAVCRGATDSCEDRLAATWNDLQNLRRNDDVRQGVYDERMPDVMDIARQMFRIDVLTGIARRHESTLPVTDPVQLYLAYVVRLRDALGLTTVVPQMRYDETSVTPFHLAAARETVLVRERVEFDKFLVLDYEPWQTLLKRKDAEAYAQAEAQAHRLLETTFEQRLREEMDKLGLDPWDEALLADARKDLGPGIMREIRYGALHPLTDKYLYRSEPA